MRKVFILITVLTAYSYKDKAYPYVILKPDSLFIEYMAQGEYSSTFELTKENLHQIDKMIINAISRDSLRNSVMLRIETVDNFARQIVPYINENNEKMVFVNCLCTLMEEPVEQEDGTYKFLKQDWKRKIIWPDDGGDCYWRIWINLNKNDYRLMVNGI